MTSDRKSGQLCSFQTYRHRSQLNGGAPGAKKERAQRRRRGATVRSAAEHTFKTEVCYTGNIGGSGWGFCETSISTAGWGVQKRRSWDHHESFLFEGGASSGSEIRQRHERPPPDQRTDRRPKLNSPHVQEKRTRISRPRPYMAGLNDTSSHSLSLTPKDLHYELGRVGPHDLQRPRWYTSYTPHCPRTLVAPYRTDTDPLTTMGRDWSDDSSVDVLRWPFARLLDTSRDSSEKPIGSLQSEPRHPIHEGHDINQSSR